VILEARLVANVFSQDVQGLVTGLIGHFENAGAIARGARQESAAQTVSRIASGIETDVLGEVFDDERDALGG
jgi:hypothetical protein